MSCEPGFGPITRLVNQAAGPSQRPELRPVTECVPTQSQGGFEQQFFQQPRVPQRTPVSEPSYALESLSLSEPWLNEYQTFQVPEQGFQPVINPQQIAQELWEQRFRTPQEATLEQMTPEQWQQEYQRFQPTIQQQDRLRRENNRKLLSRMTMNALYQFASHLMIPDKYGREQLIDILAKGPGTFRFVNSTIGRDFIGVEFTGPNGLTVVNFNPSDIQGAQLSSEDVEAYQQQQWEEEYTHRENNRGLLSGMSTDQLRAISFDFIQGTPSTNREELLNSLAVLPGEFGLQEPLNWDEPRNLQYSDPRTGRTFGWSIEPQQNIPVNQRQQVSTQSVTRSSEVQKQFKDMSLEELRDVSQASGLYFYVPENISRERMIEALRHYYPHGYFTGPLGVKPVNQTQVSTGSDTRYASSGKRLEFMSLEELRNAVRQGQIYHYVNDDTPRESLINILREDYPSGIYYPPESTPSQTQSRNWIREYPSPSQAKNIQILDSLSDESIQQITQSLNLTLPSYDRDAYINVILGYMGQNELRMEERFNPQREPVQVLYTSDPSSRTARALVEVKLKNVQDITSLSQVDWNRVTIHLFQPRYTHKELFQIARLLGIDTRGDNPRTYQRPQLIKDILNRASRYERPPSNQTQEDITNLSQVDWRKVTTESTEPHYDTRSVLQIAKLLGLNIKNIMEYQIPRLIGDILAEARSRGIIPKLPEYVPQSIGIPKTGGLRRGDSEPLSPNFPTVAPQDYVGSTGPRLSEVIQQIPLGTKLENLTLDQLRYAAQESRIQGYESMAREQLISALGFYLPRGEYYPRLSTERDITDLGQVDWLRASTSDGGNMNYLVDTLRTIARLMGIDPYGTRTELANRILEARSRQNAPRFVQGTLVNITSPEQIDWNLVTTNSTKPHYDSDTLFQIARLLGINPGSYDFDDLIIAGAIRDQAKLRGLISERSKEISSVTRELASQWGVSTQGKTANRINSEINSKKRTLSIRQYDITSPDQIDWNLLTIDKTKPHYDPITLVKIRNILGISSQVANTNETMVQAILAAKPLSSQEIEQRSREFWTSYRNMSPTQMMESLQRMTQLNHVPADFNLWAIQYSLDNNLQNKYIPRDRGGFKEVLDKLGQIKLVREAVVKSLL